MIFVDDSDELSEHVSSIIFGQGFGERDQLDAMLAQRLHRQFLLDLIAERTGKREHENCVDRSSPIGRTRNHGLEAAPSHVGSRFALVPEHADNVIPVTLTSPQNLGNLVRARKHILALGQS
nr:hypothetical protein [Tardiphaga sp.]